MGMGKLASARMNGGRRRLAMVVVGLAALAVVPWAGAEAARPTHWNHGGHDSGKSGKLLFFASDGMRQDAVERYADRGRRPRLPRPAARRRARVAATAC